MTENAESFNEQYAILKQVAETLRTQQEPDLDALIPLVDKGINAYNACKKRIEAVKKAFEEKMPADVGE
ncbi:MAG: exodeoxyribonuclease VII small subunit [Methylobacter sp.]|uniref:Exodeoxyribonuclease VII small subunit n=1 Tax=Candidatus Methylobacter titanis TaxID=3053457 RepID=A0AA43Q764_9GAMM|nr:exodeoxyribonuclease VII small subunit [Candidatus Methylobacter titanis]